MTAEMARTMLQESRGKWLQQISQKLLSLRNKEFFPNPPTNQQLNRKVDRRREQFTERETDEFQI